MSWLLVMLPKCPLQQCKLYKPCKLSPLSTKLTQVILTKPFKQGAHLPLKWFKVNNFLLLNFKNLYWWYSFIQRYYRFSAFWLRSTVHRETESHQHHWAGLLQIEPIPFPLAPFNQITVHLPLGGPHMSPPISKSTQILPSLPSYLFFSGLTMVPCSVPHPLDFVLHADRLYVWTKPSFFLWPESLGSTLHLDGAVLKGKSTCTTLNETVTYVNPQSLQFQAIGVISPHSLSVGGSFWNTVQAALL